MGGVVVGEPLNFNENSVGLSSTTNPKPKGQPSISLPAQANLTQQKAEPLRCLALRTRGGRVKKLFCPMGTLPTHLSGSWTRAACTHDHNLHIQGN